MSSTASNFAAVVIVEPRLMASKTEVDDMAAKAVRTGGKEAKLNADYGFMVQRTFEDLDGHTWEPFWMDSSHVQKG